MKKLIVHSPKHWLMTLPLLLALYMGTNSGPTSETNLTDNTFICPYCDLSGMDYSGQDLTNANLSYADLSGANFSNAILKGAILTNADLSGANFENAELGSSDRPGTNLIGANLTQASFNGTSFGKSNLQFAEITCADFSKSDISKAKFGPVLLFDEDASCKISFRNATVNCDFVDYWDKFDLSGATLPDCGQATLGTSQKKAKKRKAVSATFGSQPSLTGYDTLIYVSPNGSTNSSCGTAANPCNSIQQGIDNCSGGNCAVLVDYYKFQDTTSIELREGVSLYGGCYNGQPSVYQTLVSTTNGLPAVIGSNINSTITIHGFIIQASTPGTAGQASVALQLENSTGVQLSYCTVVSAQGSTGAAGGKGNTGATGSNGKDGDWSSGMGGDGGINHYCTSLGGLGGAKTATSFKCSWYIESNCKGNSHPGGYGSPGDTGYAAPGADGGTTKCFDCGASMRGTTPAPGANGKSAGCGTGGKANTDTIGTFHGSTWVATVGKSGTDGGAGGGGGGGGSGGSCAFCNCASEGKIWNGTPGGGGGAGGCGGGTGKGGQQGGAAFCVLLYDAQLTVLDSVEIIGTKGGDGGNGGTGGVGGKGGSGGSAAPAKNKCSGSTSSNTGAAGSKGGSGGAGGSGGGGGGGNGGPCVGVALVNGSSQSAVTGSPVYYEGSSGEIGEKGSGGSATVSGSCTGKAGANGLAGMVANTHTYTDSSSSVSK